MTFISSNDPVATAQFALIQVNQDDDNLIMEGPIKLVRSSNADEEEEGSRHTLKLNITDHEDDSTTKDIPLPTSVDWSVTSACHELWDMKGQKVKISFVCPDTKRDVKIQIALPYKNEIDKAKAMRFGRSLINANNNTNNNIRGMNTHPVVPNNKSLVSSSRGTFLRSRSPVRTRSKSPVPLNAMVPGRRQGLPTAA